MRPARSARPGALRLAMVIVVAAAAACSSSNGSSGGSTSTTSAPSTAAPTTSAAPPPAADVVPVVRSAGCTKPPEPAVQGRAGTGTEVVETIASGGGPRTYRLEVPKGDPNTAAHPLLLNLHGSGSDAVEQSVYSAFPARAGARGYVVITPDAIAKNWGLFAPTDTKSKDLVFATTLLDSIEQRFCVDTNRVFASGISLGAAYSADLACALPKRIAAVGLVAVEVLFPPCPRTLPVMVFHGTADPVVPFGPGQITESQFRDAPSPGTEANMRKWAALDRCRPTPTVTQPSSEIRLSVWTGCAPHTEVQLYAVIGGGHTWPGSPFKIDRLGKTTEQVDATALILAFFARHPLLAGAPGG